MFMAHTAPLSLSQQTSDWQWPKTRFGKERLQEEENSDNNKLEIAFKEKSRRLKTGQEICVWLIL